MIQRRSTSSSLLSSPPPNYEDAIVSAAGRAQALPPSDPSDNPPGTLVRRTCSLWLDRLLGVGLVGAGTIHAKTRRGGRRG